MASVTRSMTIPTILPSQMSKNKTAKRTCERCSAKQPLGKRLKISHSANHPQASQIFPSVRSIKALADDLIAHSFLFLSAHDLVRMGRVCKKWETLSNQNKIWATLLKSYSLLPSFLGPIRMLRSRSLVLKMKSVAATPPTPAKMQVRELFRRAANQYPYVLIKLFGGIENILNFPVPDVSQRVYEGNLINVDMAGFGHHTFTKGFSKGLGFLAFQYIRTTELNRRTRVASFSERGIILFREIIVADPDFGFKKYYTVTDTLEEPILACAQQEVEPLPDDVATIDLGNFEHLLTGAVRHDIKLDRTRFSDQLFKA